MGHQFHSILRTEFQSEVRIEKFQGFLDFGIISESMESTREFLNFGCFGQMGHQFHSVLRTEFESEVKMVEL